MKTEKDERKLSIYLPQPIVEELNTMAARLDRSKSWILQKAWELAKQDLKRLKTPYPSGLVSRFKNISQKYSQATQGMSEEEIEKMVLSTIKKVRKKASV